MQNDMNRLSMAMDARDAFADMKDGGPADATVQAALASLKSQGTGPKPSRPGELKWKLTGLFLPSIMLLFVALYVSSLTSGVEPEFALLRAGGASVVLAVLGRVAVGILGDESRLVLNDNQIVAMARDGAIPDYLSGVDAELGSDGADQPSTAAETAGAGGKE
jgi:hypothetical protein